MTAPTWEIHYGEVTGQDDPEKRGRLRVKFETLLEGEWPEWVDPCFPFAGKDCGFFALPPIGTAVECEVFRGKGADVTIDTPRIRWRAALYNRIDFIPEEWKERYPKCSGFKSPGGHILTFDDTEDKEYMYLRHGKKQNTFLNFDKNGSIMLVCENLNGGLIGFFCDTTTGSVKVFGSTSVQIESTGHVNIKGSSVTIQGRPVANKPGKPI